MTQLMKISQAANYLNVSQDTLRRWERKGKINVIKTIGGHRRYDVDDLEMAIGKEKSPFESVYAIYARVSSHDQKAKGDLDRQAQRLSEYCAKKNFFVSHIFKDVGSGLNSERKSFLKLVSLITSGKLQGVVIEHRDRLTRFQFDFMTMVFANYGCKVIVVDDKREISNLDELTQDMVSILASFAGKLYGRRSTERREKAN